MAAEKIKKQFKKHYEKYDINEDAITLKYDHSIRVMELSKLIAQSSNFSVPDIEMSIIIGLLHDYARFEQWTKYKTYSDIKSVDHGDLAIQMLFDNNEIENYYLNKENYDEIYDAIKYHNKLTIPENLSDHNKLLCKVIRDADKLDIFYLLSIDKLLFMEDEEEISEKVIEGFYKEKIIDKHNIKNKNDKIILNLAMVFDLNFKYSFKYLYDNNIIWKMYDNIDNKNRFKEYFEYIDKYIKKRMIEC